LKKKKGKMRKMRKNISQKAIGHEPCLLKASTGKRKDDNDPSPTPAKTVQ
jgi:hypothetical protein